MSKREHTLCVRATSYRGTPGFKVCGRDTDGRNISVFVRSMPLAYKIKDAYKISDLDVRSARVSELLALDAISA